MNSLDILKESGLYKEGKPLRLHLGCGQTHLDGYVNIDFSQGQHKVMKIVADAKADITTDLVFPRFSISEIRSHHMYEHFSRVIALAQLIKWHFWLKIDGVLVIETPDGLRSAKQLVDELTDYKQKMAIVRHLVGDQSEEWGYHKDLWYGERFETTLSSFGFHVTDIDYLEWDRWPYLRSIKVIASKVREVSINDQIDIAYTLLKDSMVSEREKSTLEVWKKQLRDNLRGYL